jgi:hypothetical protein
MADTVAVATRDDGSFDVEVRRGSAVTRHVVTVPAGLPAALGAPQAGAAELVQRSFEFLLEREPPSSILRSFSLDVIERYFPEYREEMARRLA